MAMLMASLAKFSCSVFALMLFYKCVLSLPPMCKPFLRLASLVQVIVLDR
jgi:hypothetical protein